MVLSPSTCLHTVGAQHVFVDVGLASRRRKRNRVVTSSVTSGHEDLVYSMDICLQVGQSNSCI